MKKYFHDMLDIVAEKLQPGEKYTAWFSGEALDYARFNHAKIRQAGTVCQQFIELDLIKDQKHAKLSARRRTHDRFAPHLGYSLYPCC